MPLDNMHLSKRYVGYGAHNLAFDRWQGRKNGKPGDDAQDPDFFGAIPRRARARERRCPAASLSGGGKGR
jgi:hypothetical protein